MRSVAILGAGIQGVCAALALRQRGYRVVLIEQESAPMLRASLRNEGKLHLGFIYANDPGLRSAQLMMISALRFAPLLDGWLPDRLRWNELRSRPFTYLIMRDSVVGVDALLSHYARVSALARSHAGEDGHYVGLSLGSVWKQIDLPGFVDPQRVVAAVGTEEVALDLRAFRAALCAALPSLPQFESVYGIRIASVQRSSNGFRVEGVDAQGQTRTFATDIVVNCLWDGRLAIDRQLGIAPSRPWLYRLKYRVQGELPPAMRALPALSLVLGPYGDVVPLDADSYLSWYPACRRGWSTEPDPPLDWSAACRGDVEPALAATVVRETLAALDLVIPGMAQARARQVDAGVVYSSGGSDGDIDRGASELHQRHAVGVHSHDGYFSIDTGKFTCAPWFAQQLADMA